MIRRLRKALAGHPSASPYSVEHHRRAFNNAFWLVRIYYAATLLFAYQEMGTIWKLMQTGGSFTPLWPIAWANDIETTGLVILYALIGTALLTVALPDRRWPRVLVFISFLSAAAFRSSFGLGSINHGNHYWLWTGFCFCFLPPGDRRELGGSPSNRYRFLLVFSFAQGLILLFYTMSGFWKAAAGVEALVLGRIGTFHPEALATIVAAKMIQLDKPTLLGPWLTQYPWVGWPVYMFVVYIELVALWIWFRPSLHRLFGVALACFHIGTFLLLGISFPKHVLILTILMIWSPFIPDRSSVRDMLFSLPGFGVFFRRPIRQQVSLDGAGGSVADVTRPGGTA
ncbi:MAG: hypothetical protein AAF543_01885 [Pseudomonadota bacterium]